MSTNNSSTLRARRRFVADNRELTFRDFFKDGKDILFASTKQGASFARTALKGTEELLPEGENVIHNVVDAVRNTNLTLRVGNILWADMNREMIKDSGFNEADVMDFSIPADQVRKVKTVEKKTSSVKKPSRRNSSNNKKAVAS